MRKIIYLTIIMVLSFMTSTFAQTGDVVQQDGFGSGLLAYILTGVFGVVVYYATKVIRLPSQDGGSFDVWYWIKDNYIRFALTLGITMATSATQYYNPEIVNTVFRFVGINLESSAVGSLASGVLIAGVVYGFVKKLTGAKLVQTDGNGNKI